MANNPHYDIASIDAYNVLLNSTTKTAYVNYWTETGTLS